MRATSNGGGGDSSKGYSIIESMKTSFNALD